MTVCVSRCCDACFFISGQNFVSFCFSDNLFFLWLTAVHYKEGRPRNLGRGVSKPKKNTVASLLAQSRAVGLKPMLSTQQLLSQGADLVIGHFLFNQGFCYH